MLLPALAQAQGANVAFGGLKHDSTLPVEVTSDQLNVNQADGSAVFSGNVLVVQGDMRLSSESVRVEYGAAGTENAGRIARMHASGNVVMVTPQEAAEADEAVYTIDSGSVVLTGNVILTQERNALSGERLVVDLNAGTGVMEGRVKTIFQPAPKE
nr:LptA/OstA family protein [Actibacterium sp. MT2.3-13A]